MAESKRRSGSGFFVGLLLGLVTGFALALLFAPQPGDATREQLADQGATLRRRGEERYAQFRGQMRARYGDAMEQGRDAYERAKDQILSQYNQGKNGQ
ncbi:MAG TPA: YtxH domain-containing protein [Ktedonobacterales bacterium]|nr:YtxH domain-containing protein [Ktedonobacterales bacterium]